MNNMITGVSAGNGMTSRAQFPGESPSGGTGTAEEPQYQPAATFSHQEEEEHSKTLIEMMQEAREKAEERREKLKLPKNTRYGDASMEAYSRLARAKRKPEVNAAAGYARRRIVQLQSAKRQDPDHARQIQAVINQLNKAVRRAGKKNRELDQERLSEQRQKKLALEKERRKAQRLRQQLLRQKSARHVREAGYIREAEIDNRLQAYLTATEMALREQAQSLATATSATLSATAGAIPAVPAAPVPSAVIGQYAAATMTPAPAPEISVEA